MERQPSRPRRDASIRGLEDVAVSWVEDALRADGHDVRDGWSPDKQPHREPDRIRRPDWFCLVDDIPTAIEHTSFLTDKRGRAWASQARAGTDLANSLRVLRIADRADPEEFDAFLDQAVARKGGQHLEWGRGVLVVTHNLDQTAERLGEAIERRGQVPWWQVYWIGRARPPLLVWPLLPAS
jgi:hypothetical protein